MFKKTISFVLSLIFTLAAFGAGTLFAGVISAGAFYDYYYYTELPGYSIFTDEELAMMQNPYATSGVNETIDGVGSVVTWTQTGTNSWGRCQIFCAHGRNMKNANHKDYPEHTDFPNTTWAAMDTINGKTFLGDHTFDGEDGIAFCVYVNGHPAMGNVSVNVRQIPCTGPYFNGGLDYDDGDHTAEELQTYGIGFQYASREKKPDANGYVHYEFRTDFYQSDWWSKDDEGIQRQYEIYHGGQPVYWPVPESKIPKISGLSFTVSGTSNGDRISIGDIRMFRDSRIHTDELEEMMMQYDELNPEAFTEDSYGEATEIYLEAYNIINDPDIGDHYSQTQVNTVAKALKAAINALKPMFMRKSESVVINGFDVLTEDDMSAINDGGSSFDAAWLDDEVVPEGEAAYSIAVIGGAFDGDPSYGWSSFTTSKLNGDGEVEAVNNVFGAENLDESAGLRFWIKYAEDYAPAPTDMIIGVGDSGSGVFFECDASSVALPEREGYVGVAWNAFYDSEGDEEIFDHINSLDYITIRIEDCYQMRYYVSDLHAFEWSMNSANFAAMDYTIVNTQDYLARLKKNDWSVRSWQRIEEALEAARALHETYAVTQQEVDKAIDRILRCINYLTPRGQTPTQEEIDALEAAYYNALKYWRGNYTGRSYAELKAALDEAGKYIDDELNSTACQQLAESINTAIANLVPITHGGTVAPTEATDANGNPVTAKLFSIEDFTGSRDLNRANGHRRENVSYDLVSTSPLFDLPAKALKMTAQTDLSSDYHDEHGALQFKLFDTYGNAIIPDVKAATGNEIGGAIGDLTGSAGLRLWIGVNDVTLAKDAYYRVGVSNISEGPLFERHSVSIPFPASGSGWIYVPWEYFEHYDDWTGGVEINPAEIRFWILRVDGVVPNGLEVYTTCISAYTDPTPTENAVPVISGVSEGETVDVTESKQFVPRWDVGTATLNGKIYYYGTPITKNDDYTLVVSNGDKQTSVSFTLTGGEAADTLPVVTGVEDGGVYEEAVTITWDVGEATLNGEAIEKGAAVSEPGDYMLRVVNGTKSVSVRFSIKEKTPPPPEVKRGDMDGDNEITVADALKALRIAAKLVAATDNDMQTGDIDKDGDITVADALKILRVAAKLADEGSLA